MELKKIITHPGGAHRDDFVAVCLLLGEHAAVTVERREPEPAELDDPAIAVVDVGGRYEPTLRNFDHHQFPREEAPRCAITLILDYLGLLEEARRFCDWLETAELIDVRGPNVTAASFGLSRDQMAAFNSPIDVGMIHRFGDQTTLEPGEPLHVVMSWIGADLAGYLSGMCARIELARAQGQRWVLDDRDGERFHAVFFPRSEPLPDEPSALLAQWVRAEGWEDDIAVLIYPDRRGTGYAVARYQDHPRFDFTRLEGRDGVRFTHPSGFVAKTSITSEEDLKALALAAVTPRR